MAEKKYYWLRLQRDFFKRHDVRIIEEMENGKDYLLFYLKLLVESIDHEGNLRFSDTVPYNDKMLSVVTNTNVDIVRAALMVFKQLDMIEVLEDETIYMSEVEKMIGASTQDEHTRESTRLRVQAYRERKKKAEIEQYRYSNVTCNGELEIEKELDIEKEINNKNLKEKDNKEKVRHKHGEYGHVVLTEDQYTKLCSDYGEEATTKAIKKVDEYCQQYGKRYKDYNLTLRKWGYDGIARNNQRPNIDDL